jgi:hypothetical protein
MSDISDPLALAAKLAQLASQAAANPDAIPDSWWNDAEGAAQSLANILRTPSENHTNVGNTSLPTDFLTFIKASTPPSNGSSIPVQWSVAALFQLFRVGANLVMDHNGNRQRLLDSGALSGILNLLTAYSNCPADKLNVGDMKVIKTGIGVLLNACVDYEPVRRRIVADRAPQIVLKLTLTLYPPNSWATAPEDSSEEEWRWRHELSSWGWRALEQFRERAGGGSPETIFTPEDIPYLLVPLKAFSPPFPKAINFPPDLELRHDLISADLDSLSEASMHLEGLTLDSLTVRVALGQAPAPHPAFPAPNPLLILQNFVEHGDLPPDYLSKESEAERKRLQKIVPTCKAAVIKVIVEVAGEDKNMEPMWAGRSEDDGKVSVPEGWFVKEMLGWIRKLKDLGSRDDLVICASLSLGNLARKESHCLALVRQPISIVQDLLPFLAPTTDIKVKHGVLALLKHLSQSSQNRAALGEAGVIERIAASKVWDETADMAQVVQVSAIAVVKHLCTSSLSNTLRLTLPPPGASSTQGPTGIEQIFDLIRRSDTHVLQSEATRVLVNVIKSLCAQPQPGEPSDEARQKAAIEIVSNEDTTDAIAELIGRNGKYPVLLNEGVVALSLIAIQPSKASIVLNALVSPLTAEDSAAPGSKPPAPSSQATSRSAGTSTSASQSAASALEMLLTILSSKDEAIRPELRSNVVTLLDSLQKAAKDLDSDGKVKWGQVKDATRPTLQEIVANGGAGVADVGAGAGAGENAKPADMVVMRAQRALKSFDESV